MAQGRKMQVRKKPRSFRSLLFRIWASRMANTSMTGTWMIRYRKVFFSVVMNILSWNMRA